MLISRNLIYIEVDLQTICFIALSLTLDQEISPFGLRSIVVEPGHFRTDIINNSNEYEPRISDYNLMTDQVFKALKGMKFTSVPLYITHEIYLSTQRESAR